MEYNKKKISFSDMKNESFRCSEPTIYEILWNGVKYEIFINYKALSNKAVIFGSGAMTLKRRKDFPIFDRISWTDNIFCTGIWYFDPTLYLNDKLMVGWGYGTNDRWYIKDIAHIIGIVLDKLKIPEKNTLFFGSSAGGFTSIMLATMFRSKASVVNAQFSIRRYSLRRLQDLENAVLKEGETIIEDRINVVDFIKKEGYVPQIHIVTNSLSKVDSVEQLIALTRGMLEHKLDCTNRIKIDFYYNDGGHSGMPSKEVCVKIIKDDLNDAATVDEIFDNTIRQGKNFAKRLLNNIR